LTKKVIGELKKNMKDNAEDYKKFLENFGPIVKE
jgi:HSP90 family molecular chaperone